MRVRLCRHMRSRSLLTVRSIRNTGIFCWLTCFPSSLTALFPEPREKREVSAWLRTQDDVLDPVPSAKNILQSFPSFRNELANLRIEALEKETWADVLLAASKSVPRP